MEERVYVIPLRSSVSKAARDKRTGKAVRTVRDFLIRHTGAERVNVSQKINQTLWKSSRQRPPKSIQVRVRVDDGTAIVKTMNEMFIEKAKEEPKGRLEQLRDKVTSQPKVPDNVPGKKGPEKEKEEAKEKPAEKKIEKPEKEAAPKQKPKSVSVKENKNEKTEKAS